ncbi:MAG: hypothetical protein RRC07_11490 [Anaerolineae bacterium]|nr:hypothetical protein [Anaerolineae bacterium]
MPPLSRWFIKTALLYLVATFVTGVLAVLDPPLQAIPGSGRLAIIYYHLFMLGWVSQLIFGVANWMFPVRSREAPRGNEQVGWASYGLLNGGLALLLIGEMLRAASSGPAALWLIVLAYLALLLAGLAFVLNTWGRIKGH